MVCLNASEEEGVASKGAGLPRWLMIRYVERKDGKNKIAAVNNFRIIFAGGVVSLRWGKEPPNRGVSQFNFHETLRFDHA